MFLATMFQSRWIQKTAVALPAFLAVTSFMFINSAQADEPAAKINSQAQTVPENYGQQAPDDFFGKAADWSAEHNAVGVWVSIPPGRKYTAEEAAHMIERKLQNMGIEAKAFSAEGKPGSGTRVIVYVGNELYGDPKTGYADFELKDIAGQLNGIQTAYRALSSSPSAIK
jgi:hypothetical protein